MAHKAPGKSSREASRWCNSPTCFLTKIPPVNGLSPASGRMVANCPQCGSTRTHEARHNDVPYRCSDCGAYFSVKTGTVMRKSQLPLRKWVFTIYLHLTCSS